MDRIRNDWLNGRMIDRLIGWLIDRLGDWLIDWMIDGADNNGSDKEWLIERKNDWSIGWLIDRLDDWLIDWMVDWLIHSLIYRYLLVIYWWLGEVDLLIQETNIISFLFFHNHKILSQKKKKIETFWKVFLWNVSLRKKLKLLSISEGMST